MKNFKLTKSVVEKLPMADKGKQADYYDSELDGFGVRVSATTKRYFVRSVVRGKRVRVMIGSTTTKSAEAARREAKILLGKMESGIDPNEEERRVTVQAKEAKKQSVTLGEALEDFLEARKLKAGTKSLYRKLFDLHLSDWLKVPTMEITSEMVRDRHKDIANGTRKRSILRRNVSKVKLNKVEPETPKRREASADGTMRILRSVLNYTFADDEENGIIRVNPVRTLSRKKLWYKVDRRRTSITNSDLPAWYRTVMTLDNPIMRDFLLFLLFTGLRRGEAATLKWNQVDFEERHFTLIGGISGVTKNKEYLSLPLSDYLYKLLSDRKEGLMAELTEAKAALIRSKSLTMKQRQMLHNRVALAESHLASPYVFPGEGKTGYIVEPKRAIDAVTVATGIDFSCHDLRRTFETIAESLDLSKYTLKALLNHKQDSGDVTAGYIVITTERLREPVQRITDAIMERVNKKPTKVTPLRKAEGDE